MSANQALEAAWMLVQVAHEEWGILSPDIPDNNFSSSHVQLYRDIRTQLSARTESVARIAELQARLDLLQLYEGSVACETAVAALTDVISQLRKKSQR